MNKKFFSKFPNLSNLALYTVILAVIGVGAATLSQPMIRKNTSRKIARLNTEIRNNDKALHTYMVNADEFKENKQMQKTLDSLRNRNVQIFCDAQNKYTERINKKYPMGRFMNATQIAQLNRTVMPYVRKDKITSQDTYNTVKKFTPFNSRSTLSQFQYVIQATNIPAEKFAPLDMIVHEGSLCFFNDARQQKLYESYLEELSHAYSDFNDNEPNFEISENAVMRDEYIRNKNNITELNNKIQSNGFLISQTIANFQHKRDSLNTLVEKLQAKLK